MIDVILTSIFPILNFIILIMVLVRLQIMRRQINKSQTQLDERAVIFETIYENIRNIQDIVRDCEVHQANAINKQSENYK